MRLHRLIAILLLLESRGRMKANELSIALETSVRSIYRDIDVLAESGIPLVTTTGPNGGISLMEGYTVSLRRLHGEEVVQLFLTGMGMPAGGSGETSLLLKNALLKLEASLPAPYQEDIRTAQRRFRSMIRRGGAVRQRCRILRFCALRCGGDGRLRQSTLR